MMIVILTMLVLTLMQAVFLYIKINHSVVTNHERLYQLETMARKLAMSKEVLSFTDCLFTETNPNDMVAMLLNDQGCALRENNLHYDYLIDDLGIYPCLKIMWNNEIHSSHHWLITVASSPPRRQVAQLRIAKPINDVACELIEPRQIFTGIISWRYLPYAAG
jgi:hypothetical protein